MKPKLSFDGPRHNAPPDANDDGDGYDRPSKSQLKRDMHALQALGVELIELPKDALARMPMPENLSDAIREARRITAHEGRRRQIQYVGRVMRTLRDDETAALRAALDVIDGSSKAETAKLHAIERTRERLLADDDVLTDFIRRYRGADPQMGRTLIRNARREAEQKKPPRYYRELFQWIKAAFDDVAEAHEAHEAHDGATAAGDAGDAAAPRSHAAQGPAPAARRRAPSAQSAQSDDTHDD